MNEKKSQVAAVSRCVFLGFVMSGRRVKICVTAKAAFKKRIRELTNRSRDISFSRYVSEVNAYTNVWIGYFGLADVWRDWRMWDEWLRRRLRLVLLKHWKRPWTRYKSLLALGATRRQAYRILRSRKGPWRLSKTPVVNTALSRDFFGSRISCPSSVNRPVRDPHAGWCGGWGE